MSNHSHGFAGPPLAQGGSHAKHRLMPFILCNKAQLITCSPPPRPCCPYQTKPHQSRLADIPTVPTKEIPCRPHLPVDAVDTSFALLHSLGVPVGEEVACRSRREPRGRTCLRWQCWLGKCDCGGMELCAAWDLGGNCKCCVKQALGRDAVVAQRVCC
eukprot:356496-Chlamydomonas_euryale.AAC.1